MDKTFEASWGGSFVTPETKIVDLDFFDEGNGYDEADLKRIGRLEINQTVSMESGHHTIKRVS